MSRDELLAAPLAVRIEHLVCRRGATTAVDDVSLSIGPGERVAVIGPNGAGKSSLLRCILGLVPWSGSVLVGGTAAGTAAEWRRRRSLIAWVPQRPAVGRFPLLVHELLASGGDLPAALQAAERLGVGGLRNRALHTLSGGQLQRVYLARGLGHLAAGAGCLLADEPTSALDFDSRDAVADLLVRLSVTSLVVTHDAGIADRADRVLEMAAGRLREVQR